MNKFQDLTGADNLVQQPAFDHYFINNLFYSSEEFNISDGTCFTSTSDSILGNKHSKVG